MKHILRLGSIMLLAAAALALLAVPAFAQGPIKGGAANPETLPGEGQHISYNAFNGAPSMVGTQVRYWVWNENVNGQNILHLRTTTGGTVHTFTGVVNTSGTGNFYGLALASADSNDSTTNITYNQFTFTIVNDGTNLEGLDVDWSGRWLSLDLYIDGYSYPKQVLYGASATPAKGNPLIVNAGAQGLLTLPLSTLDGATQFAKNKADGYFFYRDNNQTFHLRLTTLSGSDLKDYRGRLDADKGSFTAIKMFRGDTRDFYTLLGDKALKFRFLTKGYEDGLDWRMTANSGLTLTLRTDGRQAAPNVWLGSMDPAQPGIPAFTFRLVP